MVSYVPQVREEQIVKIFLCVYVCVALPMIVDVWSIAVILLCSNSWEIYMYHHYNYWCCTNYMYIHPPCIIYIYHGEKCII